MVSVVRAAEQTDGTPVMMAAIAGPARELRPLTGDERAIVETLRGFARRAQLSSPIDLHHACALIAPAPDRAADAFGAALLRALGRAALRPFAFHPRGASAVSSGERWLLSLLRALGTGDHASAFFLVNRWVARSDRRAILFLARGLSQALHAGQPRGA